MEATRCFGAKEGGSAEFCNPFSKTRKPKLFASECILKHYNCIPNPSTAFKH